MGIPAPWPRRIGRRGRGAGKRLQVGCNLLLILCATNSVSPYGSGRCPAHRGLARDRARQAVSGGALGQSLCDVCVSAGPRARWKLGQLLSAIKRASGPGRGKKILSGLDLLPGFALNQGGRSEWQSYLAWAMICIGLRLCRVIPVAAHGRLLFYHQRPSRSRSRA